MKKVKLLILLIVLSCLNKPTSPVKDKIWVVYDKKSSEIPIERITKFAINGNQIWVPAFKSIVMFDREKWSVFDTSSSEIFDYIDVYSIAFENNIVWAGCNKGLLKYENDEWYLYDSTNSTFDYKYIKNIVVDKNGIKWLTSEHKGLIKFDGGISTLHTDQNSGLPSNNISYLTFDKNDNLLLGVRADDGLKLVKYDRNNWKVFSPDSNIPNIDSANCIVEDSSDNIWLGTNNGLLMYNGNSWVCYDTTEIPIMHNYIRKMVVDKRGRLWFTTCHGQFSGSCESALFAYGRGEWDIYDSYNSYIKHDNVMWVEVDDNNNKWIAIYNDGGWILSGYTALAAFNESTFKW